MHTSLSRKVSLAVCCCILGGTVALFGSAAAGENLRPRGELTIKHQYGLPIAELSGLALFRTIEKPKGGPDAQGMSLYAVGDATHEVATLYIESPFADTGIRVKDVAPVLRKRTEAVSQWEAVAADGLNTICILSETHSEVSCLDRSLKQIRGILKLDVSRIKHLDHLWREAPNSRGEGMLLMKKGHLLVLKEKQPSMLIEFGPEGDDPIGYGPATFLGPGEAFAAPWPQELAWSEFLSYTALKTWEFSDQLEKLATDASEITLGPDGRVYLLSQESSTLIRLKKIPGEDEVNADAYWTLPAGMSKAEGLVIDTKMRPWIGIDIKQRDKPNLFRMSPIDSAP